MKMLIAVVGILGINAGDANSQTFEQQVLQISQKTSGSALQMRRKIAGSEAQRGSVPAWAPADALDETQVGVAAKFISIQPGEFEMGSPTDEEGRDSDEPEKGANRHGI